MTPGTTPSYTGNISEMDWTDTGAYGDNIRHAYTYQYDPLKRLTDSKQYDNGIQTNAYTEQGITYDRNGNIQEMRRIIGQLLYQELGYSYDGNKVTSIGRIFPKTLFDYDANGNCTFDGYNSLQFTYNFLNLPERVSKGGSIAADYLYSADGAKLGARNADGYGYDYLGSLTYKTDETGCKLESGSFDGGRIKVIDMTSIPGDSAIPLDRSAAAHRMYVAQYYLTDHLGSVRAITNKEGRVLGRNNYYPFGKRWNDDGSATFDRWQFNGKESQDGFGIDLLDYGARMYDPETGRWLTQDPHADSYVNHSPYAYCLNNPMNMIDPTGEDVYFLQSDGRMILGLLTDDGTDRIYGLNNGHVDNMNFIDVGKGFMESNFSNWSPINNRSGNLMNYTQVSYYNMSDFAEAKRTFEFLADNSEVEWGMVSDSETNHIYTSHEATKLRGNEAVLFRNNPFYHTHSHKKNPNPSDTDIDAIKQLSNDPYKLNILYKIYYNKQYYFYDGQTKSASLSLFSFY